MNTRTFLVLFGLAALLALQPVQAQARNIFLKEAPVAAGPVVTLGDIFENTGDAAAIAVATAPAPGMRKSLSVAALMNIARSNGLNWSPPRGRRMIVVTGAGRTVAREDILNALRRTLGNETGSDLDIALSERLAPIAVGPEEEIDLAVDILSYDRVTGRFSARVSANAGAAPVTLRGRAYPVSEVPVLTRNIARGETIEPDDIAMVWQRSSRLGRNVITDAALLVGMAARRSLRAGRIVRNNDVETPKIVAKGDLVSLVFIRGALQLTAIVRALESGAEGDIVRVVNPRSRKIVEMIVTAPGRGRALASQS